MDQIRKVINDMEDEERGLLKQRSAEARSLAGNSIQMLGIGTVLSFSMLLFVYVHLNRQIDRRSHSEERFRQMAENIEEAFWITDVGMTNVLYVSPAYEKIWGRPGQHLRDNPHAWLDSIHPDDHDRVASSLGHALEEENRDIEYRIVRPDGSIRWVWDRAFPVRDKLGSIYRLVGITQDITDRKQAELELKNRAAQQKAVADLGGFALEGEDLRSLFDHTVHIIAEVLDVELCRVLELLPGGDRLLLRAGVGWKEGAVGRATVGAGAESQAGFTLLSSAPVVVEDLRRELRFRGAQLLHEHGIVSGMSTIIGDRQHPWGVLGVHSTTVRKFTEDDVHFIKSVAGVLAATIERRRAEEELRKLNEDLERRVAARTAELATLNKELEVRNREVERANRLKSEFLAA
jgi:PAS domain S-box-containing protein